MAAWWKKPLRAVTLEFPASDVATIDVASIVDESHWGHANTLCVFATGYYPGGTAFYPSAIAPHYPGLSGRDLLQEAITAARRNGQHVIAYLASIWGDAEMYRRHPDWAQRKANGSVTSWDDAYTSVAMCPNSPYRDYFASLVREISETYPVDGFYFDEPSFQSWCNCSYCQEKFYSETHRPLPTEEKWDDPTFLTFLRWRFQQISSWRDELYRLAKTDERCIFFQGAFPLTRFKRRPYTISGVPELNSYYQQRFGVWWHVPLAHAADLAQPTATGDLIHFELYRSSVSEPLWWYGISLRYGQAIAQSKQILVLSMMAQSPFDLLGLSDAELRLSVAEILANGGAPLFARYYPDQVDQEGWDRAYRAFEEAKALSPYLHKRESIKYAALLFSEHTLHRFDHTGDRPEHLVELKGFAKALLQSQLPFDIVTERDLARLHEYRVLILTNASCLSSEAKAAIRAFAADGGGIVGSYESGMYDEHGRRTPEDDFSKLFGLSYQGPRLPFQTDVYLRLREKHVLPLMLPTGKRVPTGGAQVSIEAEAAEVVADLLGGSTVHYAPLGTDPQQPAILCYSDQSSGRSTFFAPPLGARYLEFGVEDHRSLIAAAVTWAAQADAPVRTRNAPRTLALTAFYQPAFKRTLIHLVNSVRDEVTLPISEVHTHTDITVELEVGEQPANVFSLGDEGAITWSMEGGVVRVQISSLTYHRLIVIEHAEAEA
ncbi:MAG: family 10 glycosylhydrolase [Trueperaceae bacterium]|nr:MAG: family 10 glycosylhydrolase [Trueperaceae bacterium]